RARDLDRSANAAAPFSEDDDGATRKEIGNLLRLDVVRVESREVHVDAGEYRRVDVAAESRRRLLRLVGSVHDERFRETCTRDAFDEVSVHAAADSEGKEVGAVEPIADVVEDVPFRFDVAVGHEHNGP